MTSETKSETKYTKQIVGAVLVVVVLVGLVTWVAQYQTTKPFIGKDGTALEGTSPTRLDIPVRLWEWEKDGLASAGEYERLQNGHHDFWFHNRNDVIVDVGAEQKSCKCSSLYICVLTPQERDSYRNWAVATAVYQMGQLTKFAQDLATAEQAFFGPLDLLETGSASEERAGDVKLKWQQLEIDGAGVQVPPKHSGLVRLAWDGRLKERAGPEKLQAILWTQAHDDRAAPRDRQSLELPVAFASPVQFEPETLKIDEIGLGQERTAEFNCWSPSRADFALAVRELTGDRCTSCVLTPMTLAECAELSRERNSRVLSGYRVRVTVRERIADNVQMPLGPFVRRIMLKTDVSPNEAEFTLTGGVLGELKVGMEEDKGRVSLGAFQARTGATKSVVIMAQQPGIDLKADDIRVEPEHLRFLKVSLKKEAPVGGNRRWRLQVEAPRGCPPGKLPPLSAVVLQLNSDPPRQVRIPVTGMAYQQ